MSWIKRHKTLFIFLSLCILSAITITFFNKKKQNDMPTHAIGKGSIMECVYGIGTVLSNKSYELKTGVSGKVKKIFVKEGDFVEKGDKLAELETIFTAPFSGTIISISCYEGEMVFSSSVIMMISDLSDRYIKVILDQKSILKISTGKTVKLSFETLRDQIFEGKISAIYPYDNKFHVRIEAPNLPLIVLPGMTGDAAIEITEHSDVLLIPLAAIDKDKVSVKRENSPPEPVAVQIGLTDGTMAEVTSSTLKEGDMLFLHTPQNIK